MKTVSSFLFLVLLALPLLGASTTEKKIKHSVVSLDKSVKEQKKTHSLLEKIAKDIEKTKKDNKILNNKLENLSQQYSSSAKEYEESKKELSAYDKNLKNINKELRRKQDRFIQTLASQSSIIYAMSQTHEATRESIVMREAYRLLKEQNSKDLATLKKQIDQNRAIKRKIITKRVNVKRKIDKISKQRVAYKRKRKTKQNLLKKLERDEDLYQAKIQKVMDEQHALRATLADLNILKKKEVEEEKRILAAQKAAMRAEEKRKREERKKRRIARQKARKAGKKVVYNTDSDKVSPPSRVKDIGSSYSRSKVYAYHGGKTISPISGARVIKKFGSYVDPIYKIKIFNQSITLRAPSSNAKVKNILNGKVVFSGASSMLGKVVVVSHSGKMHTVYAGLSQIAPTIKKGRRIKKGYVIGKVSRKLIFEATKNSKHINPMSLIRL